MITTANRAEGFSYSLFLAFFTISPGILLCLTVIGAVLGLPMILIGLWALLTSPWAYKKLRAGPCPVCDARCVFPPKVRARKCPDCKTRLIQRGDELCKVE